MNYINLYLITIGQYNDTYVSINLLNVCSINNEYSNVINVFSI